MENIMKQPPQNSQDFSALAVQYGAKPQLLEKPIQGFGFHPSAELSLINIGLTYIGELVQRSENELCPLIGGDRMHFAKSFLTQCDLRLDMRIRECPDFLPLAKEFKVKVQLLNRMITDIGLPAYTRDFLFRDNIYWVGELVQMPPMSLHIRHKQSIDKALNAVGLYTGMTLESGRIASTPLIRKLPKLPLESPLPIDGIPIEELLALIKCRPDVSTHMAGIIRNELKYSRIKNVKDLIGQTDEHIKLLLPGLGQMGVSVLQESVRYLIEENSEPVEAMALKIARERRQRDIDEAQNKLARIEKTLATAAAFSKGTIDAAIKAGIELTDLQKRRIEEFTNATAQDATPKP